MSVVNVGFLDSAMVEISTFNDRFKVYSCYRNSKANSKNNSKTNSNTNSTANIKINIQNNIINIQTDS